MNVGWQASTSALKCPLVLGDFGKPRAIARKPSSRRRFYAASSRLLFRLSRGRASLDSRRLAGLFFHFAFRFLESALDFILCARFHKNKIARYERGGCKLVCN